MAVQLLCDALFTGSIPGVAAKQAIELRDLLLDIINYRCCCRAILIINLLLLFRSGRFELVIFRYWYVSRNPLLRAVLYRLPAITVI